MKEYIIPIEVVSTTYEICEAIVEANSPEEAVRLFEKDPYNYEWDFWETIDSVTASWEIDKYSPVREWKETNNA